MGKVNETQILVLKEQDGYLQVTSIPIEDASFIINEINAAVENPNKTLLDVQFVFFNNFQGIKDYYLYLYPYSYNSSYVSGAIKPKKYMYSEYEAELNKAIKGKNVDKNADVTQIIADENKYLKQNYASLCIRYIKQQLLHKAFQNAANNSSVKMYSCESIGWSSFEYIITNDLKACVYTNLGYGYASYFTLIISYKGIVIAPFSHIVKYYYANMTDIIRCTRDYYVEKENWRPMFEFVKEFANHSLSDPVSFVKKYIMNEIDEMMKGLRNIMSNPTAIINMFKEQDQNSSEYKHLRLISPMSSDEKQRFLVFPYEMPVIFKSEKLSQATKILEKLKELIGIYPPINDYIQEIIDMVINLTPDIETTINKIQVNIDILMSQKESKEKFKNLLQIQIDEFNLELDNILKKLSQDTDWQKIEEIRKQYEKEHPLYGSTKEKLQIVKKEISEINDKIYSRNSLIERLQKCIKDLTPYLSETS